MSTTKAQKEAKLKARKTSLSKKTNQELIDIILKKDNTERKNNDKIMTLRRNIDDLNVVIDSRSKALNEQENLIEDLRQELALRLDDVKMEGEKINLLEKDIANSNEMLKSLQKTIDSYKTDMKLVHIYKYCGISFFILSLILCTVLIFC